MSTNPGGRFADRTVIVTGGSKGIGAGCVEVFARESAFVAILDVDATAGEKLADGLNLSTHGQVSFYQCDVSDAGELQRAINGVADEFGRLDCIINNAGVHPPATSIEEQTLEDLQKLIEVNFISTYLGAKFALPHLKKTCGTIINVSSMTAVLGQDHSSAYAATKGAQLSLTKALAVELGPQGIRVNAILPSNVDTPLMRDWAATLPDPESALKRVADFQVFNRMAVPTEIGTVALFLATEDSSFVTGQGIEVEGGASLDY